MSVAANRGSALRTPVTCIMPRFLISMSRPIAAPAFTQPALARNSDRLSTGLICVVA